jgi:hypothetical protein
MLIWLLIALIHDIFYRCYEMGRFEVAMGERLSLRTARETVAKELAQDMRDDPAFAAWTRAFDKKIEKLAAPAPIPGLSTQEKYVTWVINTVARESGYSPQFSLEAGWQPYGLLTAKTCSLA